MRFRILLFLIIPFISSCKDETPPPDPVIPPGNSEVLIQAIQLSNYSVSTDHNFKSEWNLIFKNKETMETYSLVFLPNRFPHQEKIVLPFGEYSYSFESDPIPEFSEFLPVRIQGEFEAKTEKTDLSLSGIGLSEMIRINANFPMSAPQIVSPIETSFYAIQDFFRIYTNSDQFLKLKVENPGSYDYLTLFQNAANSNSIRLYWPDSEFIYDGAIRLNEDGFPLTLPLTPIADLDDSQNETSGLAQFEGRLFAINDGDNPNRIYELDPISGEVLRSILVENAINRDWESLAQSETHLFIGDFGNNQGTRQDLAIYRIPWQQVLNQETVQAEKIDFRYINQDDFSPSETHRFDCEAFLFWEGKLHLFTKNRASEDSDHHVLPIEPGNYITEFVETLPVNKLVTGACIDPISGKVILLGYKLPLQGFLSLWEGMNGELLGENFGRIQIAEFPMGLTEGIVFTPEGNTWISSERVGIANVVEINPQLGIVGLEGIF
ncbi:hypothetical protein E4S40_09660 [Algoriphagus kandeliae]|uniref:Uncharacterized protein n=1 Tax=Algoriphagus kandeliae TaxID=2562278 RepID=A0A4Y9QRP8_9BACT|nr:hypothetical protein [Algoriphagus kandeliae]TFV94292.1 hypothetical protein E4S40_09660 [Algoriphagus kandeliae]